MCYSVLKCVVVCWKCVGVCLDVLECVGVSVFECV